MTRFDLRAADALADPTVDEQLMLFDAETESDDIALRYDVFETLAALLYAFLWYRRWPTPAEAAGIALLTAGVVLGVRAFRR